VNQDAIDLDRTAHTGDGDTAVDTVAHRESPALNVTAQLDR
jgi:hypothetical protein